MIRDSHAWEAWENNYRKGIAPDFQHNLKIYEALYQEALTLGVLPSKKPLEGLQVKIRLAKAINVRTTAGNPGDSA